MIGGYKSSSYYFYAKDINYNMYYLDPHQISQYSSDLRNINKHLAKTYFKTHIDLINPSITFCFSYKNYDEFMELKKFLEKKTIFNILNIDDYRSYECKSDRSEWEVISL